MVAPIRDGTTAARENTQLPMGQPSSAKAHDLSRRTSHTALQLASLLLSQLTCGQRALASECQVQLPRFHNLRMQTACCHAGSVLGVAVDSIT